MLDALCVKHPESHFLPTSILLTMDDLPFLEGVEINGTHIQSVTHYDFTTNFVD